MIILGKRQETIPSYPTLSEYEEGTIIKIPESSRLVEFYLSKHNYEPGLNGNGRTLLIRKDIYDLRAWDSDNQNYYATSDIDGWFNGSYKNLLGIQVDPVKFYYAESGSVIEADILERFVFTSSATELGLSGSFPVIGATLPVASAIRAAMYNGENYMYWTRTPVGDTTTQSVYMQADANNSGNANCRLSLGSRPCFCLYEDTLIDPDTMEVIP